MIVIQRVRVRWTAAARGAPAANARRGLDRAVALPRPLPETDVVVHDVLADEAVNYERNAQELVGGVELARDVGLWLECDEATVTVDRLPGAAAYPRPYASTRLFALTPGQVGRYRANFRFTGCACAPSWYYEDWLVHVSYGQVPHDHFVRGQPDHDATAYTSTAGPGAAHAPPLSWASTVGVKHQNLPIRKAAVYESSAGSHDESARRRRC